VGLLTAATLRGWGESTAAGCILFVPLTASTLFPPLMAAACPESLEKRNAPDPATTVPQSAIKIFLFINQKSWCRIMRHQLLHTLLELQC